MKVGTTLTCPRSSARAIRQLNKDVVIHGGRYYGTLLVVIESGLLYSVALVRTLPVAGPPLSTHLTVEQIITICLFAIGNNGVYVITDMLGHLTVRAPLSSVPRPELGQTLTPRHAARREFTPPRSSSSSAST